MSHAGDCFVQVSRHRFLRGSEMIFGLDTGFEYWQLGLMAAGSLLIGLTGGTVGIALGVIRLPMLTFFGVDPLLAAGTNLIISVMGSGFSTITALLNKSVLWSVVLAMGGPAILGAFIGGYFSGLVPIWILLVVVAGLMAWSSLWLVYWSLRVINLRRRYPQVRRRKAVTGQTYRGVDWRRSAREGVAGLAIGLIGGAVGLVLGVLRMPALLAMRIEPHKAAGTNLAITVLVGLAGFGGHVLRGNVDWVLVVIVGVPGVLGMVVGTHYANRFDATGLRLVVGLVILLVAPVVVWSAIQRF